MLNGSGVFVLTNICEDKCQDNSHPIFMNDVGMMPIICHTIKKLKEFNLANINVVMNVANIALYKDKIESFLFDLDISINFIASDSLESLLINIDSFLSLLNSSYDNLLLIDARMMFINIETINNMYSSLNQSNYTTNRPFTPGSIAVGQKPNLDIIAKKSLCNADNNANDASVNFIICNTLLLLVHSSLFKQSLKRAISLFNSSGTDAEKPTGSNYNSLIITIIYALEHLGIANAYLEVRCDESIIVDHAKDICYIEERYQDSRRNNFMNNGVILKSPETVYFAADTIIESGTTVDPYVIFGSNVKIGRFAKIKSFSYIENTEIKANEVIGPFVNCNNGNMGIFNANNAAL